MSNPPICFERCQEVRNQSDREGSLWLDTLALDLPEVPGGTEGIFTTSGGETETGGVGPILCHYSGSSAIDDDKILYGCQGTWNFAFTFNYTGSFFEWDFDELATSYPTAQAIFRILNKIPEPPARLVTDLQPASVSAARTGSRSRSPIGPGDRRTPRRLGAAGSDLFCSVLGYRCHRS